MKLLSTLFLIILNISLITPTSLFATTATPSATITPNMADQVKALVKDNLATTEARLKEKVDLQSLVGFVGTISTISSQNLTIESRNNLMQVSTTTKTAFLKDSSPIKISSLAIGDKVIVIGTSAKEGIVQAKRLTVIKDEPILVTTTVAVSKIVSIDLKKKTITLSINGSDKSLTLSKKSTVNLEELKPEQTILGIVKEYNGALSLSRAKTL